MSDVTRWDAYRPTMVRSGTGQKREYVRVVIEADHLAALERVRVETLREVKTAVLHLPVVGRLAGTDSALAAVHVLAAIDRIINATTTGDTDA